jgi:hypothetical protein
MPRPPIEFLGSRIWTAIERFANVHPKTVAVAYFSLPTPLHLRKGDVVITNASAAAVKSGQTSAPELLKAATRGVKIYSVPSMHAKVLYTRRAALVSSANLSLSSRSLNEAGILVSEPRVLAQVGQYLGALRRQAKRPLRLSELRALAALEVSRAGFSPRPPTPSRPSLLEAIQASSSLLENVAFTWYELGPGLSESTISKEARRRGIHLPRDRWQWFESDDFPGAAKDTLRWCSDRPLVCWQVRLGSDGLIHRFAAHEPYALPLIDALRFKNRLVSIVGTTPYRTGIDLRRDRKELSSILNKGIQASTRLRKAISEDPLARITLSRLEELYEVGCRAA